jgi:diacylglycerol kinase family enzyme
MHRRVAAWLALVLGTATVLAVAGFLVAHLGLMLLALAALTLAGGAGWYAVTEAGLRRGVGAVACVAGVALAATAMTRALGVTWDTLVRLGLVTLLALGAVVAARIAVSSPARHPVFVRSQPPQRPVLICNLRSGGGKVEQFDLLGLASEMGVRTVVLEPGLDLERLARDAAADGADCLGMAGGDGSQALVASVAIDVGLPFVCVSAGTRNHFAQDLGLHKEDPRSTMAGFTSGLERRVDVATVDDGSGPRLFVNNVSLGIYATVVQEEGYREAKVSTAAGLLPALLGQEAEPFDLQFSLPDRTEVDGAFLVMVSNNPYVLAARPDLAQRNTLDSGRLGVFAVSTPSGAEAAALVALGALGQQRRSPWWHEFSATSFEVRSRSGSAFAGVDGEALDLSTPLRFDIHPAALRVMVPPDNPDAVRQRRARSRGLDDLLRVARGEGEVRADDPRATTASPAAR